MFRIKLKSVISLIYLSIASSICYAQNNQAVLEGGMIQVRIFDDDEDKKDYEGSPYLNEDFSEASINSSETTYKVRYNTYTDQVEVMTEKGAYFILDYSDKNYEIYMRESGNTIERIRFSNLKESYAFILWESDKKQLVKTYKKNFIPKQEANGYKAQTKARFTSINESYFIVNKNDNYAIEIPKSKNRIYKEIFDKSFKVKASKLDLDPSVESDLIALLNIFYRE